MTRLYRVPLWLLAPCALVGWVSLGCGGDALGPASVPNFIDTVTLYALRGTPITRASGFDIVSGLPARTDRGEIFDFAFDIDETGASIIYPAGALGLRLEAGLQLSDRAFDEIDRAPEEDYSLTDVLTVSVGDVFVGRSRRSSALCGFLGRLPRYGKFEVIAEDQQSRSITLKYLVDVNCGFRGLEPGFPTS